MDDGPFASDPLGKVAKAVREGTEKESDEKLEAGEPNIEREVFQDDETDFSDDLGVFICIRRETEGVQTGSGDASRTELVQVGGTMDSDLGSGITIVVKGRRVTTRHGNAQGHLEDQLLRYTYFEAYFKPNGLITAPSLRQMGAPYGIEFPEKSSEVQMYAQFLRQYPVNHLSHDQLSAGFRLSFDAARQRENNKLYWAERLQKSTDGKERENIENAAETHDLVYTAMLIHADHLQTALKVGPPGTLSEQARIQLDAKRCSLAERTRDQALQEFPGLLKKSKKKLLANEYARLERRSKEVPDELLRKIQGAVNCKK